MCMHVCLYILIYNVYTPGILWDSPSIFTISPRHSSLSKPWRYQGHSHDPGPKNQGVTGFFFIKKEFQGYNTITDGGPTVKNMEMTINNMDFTIEHIGLTQKDAI